MNNLLVFDVDKGNEEGCEQEKILAFEPACIAEDLKIRVVGLLQGLLQFVDVFQEQASSETESIETEDNLLLVRKLAFKSIHVAIVLEKSKLGRHVCASNLMGLLSRFSEASELLLDGSSEGKSLRGAFEGLAKLFLDELNDPSTWLRKQLRNPFGATFGANFPSLPVRLSLHLNESVNCLLEDPGIGSYIHGIAITFHEYFLWTSFTTSKLQKLEQFFGYKGNRAISNRYEEILHEFITTEKFERPADQSTPKVQLVMDGQLSTVKLVKCNDLVLIAALSPKLEDETQYKLEDNFRSLLDVVNSFLSQMEIKRKNLCHVPGSRYCFRSSDNRIKCSPREKVSASSHHSRSFGTSLLDSAPLWQGGLHASSDQKEFRITSKSNMGAWGVVQGDAQGIQVTVSDRCGENTTWTHISNIACIHDVVKIQ
eukprot:jgi/Picsp_1/5747/NSC_03106-R1_---NA---